MTTLHPFPAALLLALAFVGQLAFCVVDNDCNTAVAVCYSGYCQYSLAVLIAHFNIWGVNTCEEWGTYIGGPMRHVDADGLCRPTVERCNAIGCTEDSCTFCGPLVREDVACLDKLDGSTCALTNGGPGVLGSCESGNCVVSQANDPVFTGYDGRKFHFDEAGTFAVQEDGEGYKVESTFADGLGDGVERSFTQGVRVFGPNVTVLPSGATKSATLTAPSIFKNLTTMSVTADVSNGPVSYVRGCTIETPRFQVQVYQVIGSEQAANHDFEEWAAPFTWLNMNLALRKPLIPPVTGILGSTYPKDPAAEVNALRQATVEASDSELPSVSVSVSRRLHGSPEVFLMTAGISD
ncbi:hypothetical protein N2152v2_007823 [Parachlorella kessleri]